MEALLFANPDSHSCSLAQKLTNQERQCFSLENRVTAACYPGNHCCSLPQGIFAADSYPSKSLLLASAWSHLLLLLASDRPGRQCFSLTQSVTATRQLTEPLLLATSGSHCSQVHGTIAAYKPSKSVLSASPISHCGSLAQAVSAVT